MMHPDGKQRKFDINIFNKLSFDEKKNQDSKQVFSHIYHRFNIGLVGNFTPDLKLDYVILIRIFFS